MYELGLSQYAQVLAMWSGMISRVKNCTSSYLLKSHLDSDTPMRIELEVMLMMRRENPFIESARHD